MEDHDPPDDGDPPDVGDEWFDDEDEEIAALRMDAFADLVNLFRPYAIREIERRAEEEAHAVSLGSMEMFDFCLAVRRAARKRYGNRILADMAMREVFRRLTLFEHMPPEERASVYKEHLTDWMLQHFVAAWLHVLSCPNRSHSLGILPLVESGPTVQAVHLAALGPDMLPLDLPKHNCFDEAMALTVLSPDSSRRILRFVHSNLDADQPLPANAVLLLGLWNIEVIRD